MAGPAFIRRSYGGGAPAATIVNPMGASDTSFTITPATGWTTPDGNPLGVDGPFVVRIDPGLISEEKILCSLVNVSSGVVNVYNVGGFSGRGYDQTSATTHTPSGGSPNSGVVQPCLSAVEAAEFNEAVTYVLGLLGGTQAPGQVFTWGSSAPTWATAGSGSIFVPQTGFTASGQSSAATSWTDLATVGPQVTMVTGDSVIVYFMASMANATADNSVQMSIAVSGASSQAAPAGTSIIDLVPSFPQGQTVMGFTLITALNPGTNVFTAKYQVGGSTGSWGSRLMAVQRLD